MNWKTILPVIVLISLCGDRIFQGPTMCQGGTLNGYFTISDVQDSVNGAPNTGAFDHLVGVGLPFYLSFSFDSMAVVLRSNPQADIYHLVAFTTPVHVTISGDPTDYLQDAVAASFEGQALKFELENDETIIATSVHVEITGLTPTDVFSFEILKTNIGLGLDENHYPILASFTLTNTAMLLERYDHSSLAATDVALGSGDFFFDPGGTVVARHLTLGQLKTHFLEAGRPSGQ